MGTFGDANFNAHGFLLKNGRFTTIDVPGTSCGPDCFFGTFANGNPQGDIVGYYNDGDGHVHGFLLHGGAFGTIDPPGSSFTQAWGINAEGDIVGYYVATESLVHGFLVKK